MIIIERILAFLLVYAIIGAVFMWYKSKNKDEYEDNQKNKK